MQKQSQAEQNRERKRAEFSAPSQPKGRSTLVLVIVAVVAIAGAVAYALMSASGDTPASAPVATGGQSGGANDIRIPLAQLDAKAKFFDFKTADNNSVRFFAIKSSDGVYRAALDACDVCFAAKKGYRQKGDDMVCNNCGNHFHSAQINEVKGGCNPVGLERKVNGDRLDINAKELEAGASYF